MYIHIYIYIHLYIRVYLWGDPGRGIPPTSHQQITFLSNAPKGNGIGQRILRTKPGA